MIEYSAKNSNLTMTVYNTVDSSHGNDSAGNFTATEAVTYQYWAAFLGLFVLLTLFGNILVVLAVIKVRTLQSVTNYLILSLAIADIFVGALVMPLAVYVEVSEIFAVYLKRVWNRGVFKGHFHLSCRVLNF